MPGVAGPGAEAESAITSRGLRYLAPAWAIGGWILVGFGDWQAFEPWGQRWLCDAADILFMGQSLAPLPAILLLIRGRARRNKAEWIGATLVLGLWCAATVALPMVHRHIRYAAVPRVETRARPLVRAIDAFARDRGRPPMILGELIPAYLREVPDTGLGAFPAFEYEPRDPVATLPANRTGADAPCDRRDPWTLQILTSFGMNFDSMVYIPSGRYPEFCWGGRVVPIGAWAYVWE